MTQKCVIDEAKGQDDWILHQVVGFACLQTET